MVTASSSSTKDMGREGHSGMGRLKAGSRQEVTLWGRKLCGQSQGHCWKTEKTPGCFGWGRTDYDQSGWTYVTLDSIGQQSVLWRCWWWGASGVWGFRSTFTERTLVTPILGHVCSHGRLLGRERTWKSDSITWLQLCSANSTAGLRWWTSTWGLGWRLYVKPISRKKRQLGFMTEEDVM